VTLEKGGKVRLWSPVKPRYHTRHLILKQGKIMNRPKLTVISNNPNVRTYYVPLTVIQVDLYPVRASSPEQALRKVNSGQFERIEKRVTLEEIQSNAVYTTTDIDPNELVTRNVDTYEVKSRDYDAISDSNPSGL
jgi:hypothetical protein